MLTEWWKLHGHPEIRLGCLSPLGVVANIDDKPSAISFLYMYDGSKMAQMAWTTSNPEVSGKKKHRAINECIKTLLEIAKLNGRTDILCFSSSSGLTKMMQKHGLNVGGSHDVLAGYFEGK